MLVLSYSPWMTMRSVGLRLGAMAAASWREVRTGEKICRPMCAASRKVKVAAARQRLAAWGL